MQEAKLEFELKVEKLRKRGKQVTIEQDVYETPLRASTVPGRWEGGHTRAIVTVDGVRQRWMVRQVYNRAGEGRSTWGRA
jgi:hypothetical protein